MRIRYQTLSGIALLFTISLHSQIQCWTTHPAILVCILRYNMLSKQYIHRKTGQSLVGDTEIERFFIGRNWGTTSEAEIHIRQIAKNETRAGVMRRFDLEKETETLP